MRAIALVNAAGGSAGEDSRERVAAALDRAGVDAAVESVPGDALAERAGRFVGDGGRLVIAAGGDGTMGAVAGALAGTSAAMALLPLGTLNHFARDLAIPADLDQAAAVIAAGQSRLVDIAEVNGRAFLNNASIGVYPLMVVDRDSQRQRLGRSKRLAMLVASLRTMARFHVRRLVLRADRGEERVDTPLLFVGNNDYRLAIPAAGRRDRLDDGRLCVLVMRSKGVPGMLAATLRALLGLGRPDDMVRLEAVRELEVGSARPHLTLAIDGETVRLAPPLHFRIRPRALAVIAPQPAG